MYLYLAASHNSVLLSCSTIVCYKQVGQKGVEHVIWRQARGLSGKFSGIISSVFNSLAFTQPHFLSFPTSARRQKGGVAQARTGGKGWQAGGRGQEQGSFRCDGTGREGKFAGGGRNRRRAGVEEAEGDGRTKKGRCMLVACLVVVARQQKLKLICSHFIHGVV